MTSTGRETKGPTLQTNELLRCTVGACDLSSWKSHPDSGAKGEIPWRQGHSFCPSHTEHITIVTSLKRTRSLPTSALAHPAGSICAASGSQWLSPKTCRSYRCAC